MDLDTKQNRLIEMPLLYTISLFQDFFVCLFVCFGIPDKVLLQGTMSEYICCLWVWGWGGGHALMIDIY
jgi:hypothetical protein